MRYYEIPPEERKKLISSEKAATWKYAMIKIGFYLGVIGTIAFFIAFFYQNSLNEAGFHYRRVELYSITIVFIGWITFLVFCRILGISTRNLNYPKLMAILRNEVLEVPDEHRLIRKQIAAALGCLDDRWALYPSIFADDPRRFIPMVAIGPGGVYGMYACPNDPKKSEFVDPAPGLVKGCEDLQKRLKHPVKPILVFMRKVKNYENDIPDLYVYQTHEMVSFLSSRTDLLSQTELKTLEVEMRFISNLGSGVVHQYSKFTKHEAERSA